MVIGLNGRIPLNTAGNLAGQTGGIPFPLHSAPHVHLRRRRGTRAAPGQLGQRGRPDIRAAERVRPELRLRSAPSTIPPRAPLLRQYPGRQRRHRRPADPAPEPARRYPPAPENDLRHRDRRRHELRLRGDGPGQRRPEQPLYHAQRRCRPRTTLVFGTDATGDPVVQRADAAGCRPVGRGRLDTGRNLCAGVSQSAGDQPT